jgi:hypothetical protein
MRWSAQMPGGLVAVFLLAGTEQLTATKRQPRSWPESSLQPDRHERQNIDPVR